MDNEKRYSVLLTKDLFGGFDAMTDAFRLHDLSAAETNMLIDIADRQEEVRVVVEICRYEPDEEKTED